jgi:penicillin-binding protein 2
MTNGEALKNPYLEKRLFANRAWVAAVVIFTLMFVSLGRLAYLQIIHHNHFATLSKDNRVRLVAVPPPRGLIYDRHGVLLAENLPSYHLEIIPSQVADMDATLARLAELIALDQGDLKRFRGELRRKQSFQSIPLRFNLTDVEVARFAVNRHRFPGVDINARLGRHYPLGQRGVHALGYVGRINERELGRLAGNNYNGTSHIGKLGVERYYEDILHGQVGFQHVEINAQGRVLRVLDEQSPVPGKDLVLSLDTHLQQVAEESLGASTGAVVVMEPATGEVLALVSMPTYDPNLFVNGISVRDYKALRDHPEQPLFNRALTGQYPPGSTIKPFVALAGLEYGATWAEKKMWAGGYYTLPNSSHRYRDWKRGGHGEVDMMKAITQSCDVYFYDLAHKVGIDHLHEFLARFGLGRRTGLDATGEAGGLLPSREWKQRAYGQVWFPGETVIAGIGQGYVLTTPLQLAAATATLAMHGTKVRPRLLHALREEGGGAFTPASTAFEEPVRLSDASYWDQVLQAMIDVVHKRNGTARRIGKDAPYVIAGKTGTAQVFGLKQDERYDEETIDKKLRDHALFVAFAPAHNPQIAVAVVVENGGHGGSVAAPIARRVMDYYLLGNT